MKECRKCPNRCNFDTAGLRRYYYCEKNPLLKWGSVLGKNPLYECYYRSNTNSVCIHNFYHLLFCISDGLMVNVIDLKALTRTLFSLSFNRIQLRIGIYGNGHRLLLAL